jgi:hypothetical protein
LQVFLRRTREVGRVQWSLRDRDITGCVDKCLELGIGDLVSLDPEAVNTDSVTWPLLRIVTVGAHRVRLSRNPSEILSHASPVNTALQSFFMLTTVQFLRLAVSISGYFDIEPQSSMSDVTMLC